MEAWLSPRVGRNAPLERLTHVIDWECVEPLVAGIHAAPAGRPSYPPLLMVKAMLLQQWYRASDPAMEEALWERVSFRWFVGLGLQDDAPDHSTISRPPRDRRLRKGLHRESERHSGRPQREELYTKVVARLSLMLQIGHMRIS